MFNETVPLTGLVVTKLDGTAKAGVLFALASSPTVPRRCPFVLLALAKG